MLSNDRRSGSSVVSMTTFPLANLHISRMDSSSSYPDAPTAQSSLDASSKLLDPAALLPVLSPGAAKYVIAHVKPDKRCNRVQDDLRSIKPFTTVLRDMRCRRGM